MGGFLPLCLALLAAASSLAANVTEPVAASKAPAQGRVQVGGRAGDADDQDQGRLDNDEDSFGPSVGHIFVTTPKDESSGGFLPADKSCVCVPYYQCDSDQNVNQDGVDIIDIRIKEGKCEHYLDYCCNLQSPIPTPLAPTDGSTYSPLPSEPTPTPFQPDPPTPSYPSPLPPDQNPPDYPPTAAPPITDYPHPTPPPQPQVCGQRNPEGIGFRITGGEDGEAQFGEFPWMVAILQEEVIEGQSKPLHLYQCGGALITPQVVLTGAHCVSNKLANQIKIRAGEWDTQTTKEQYIHQDRTVTEIVIHSKFNPRSLHNDMALLILSDPVQIGGHIGLICLPEQDQLFDHKRCFASGWGKDKFEKDGQYQVILKKRDLPIVPHALCQEQLRRTRLGNYFLLDSSFICAGGESGRDTCKGDGGSPLVCPMDNDPNRYYQAGIVAWGIDCGLADTPGVYGSVARFRHWIDTELQKLNIDISGYQT